MEQRALELISERVEAALSEQGFSYVQKGKADSNRPSLFLGESVAYAVVYDKKLKRFEFKQAQATDGKVSDEWKSVSVWLFDPENDTMQEAESIANDFCDSLAVFSMKKQAAAAAKQRKKEKGEEKYADPLFLMNRFVPIFPELKFAIQAHKEMYGALIPHALTKEFICPMMNQMLADPKQKEKTEKFFDVLNQNYKNGDLDTKSIITLGILNQIEGEAAVKTAAELLNEATLKAWQCARKYKHKKVKPEKVKKMQKLLAEKSTRSLR